MVPWRPAHVRCAFPVDTSDCEDVIGNLRHADIRTTMNVYTQAVSEQKRAGHSKVVQMVLSA
jgi:hypothetical protein